MSVAFPFGATVSFEINAGISFIMSLMSFVAARSTRTAIG